jgi:predicted O-methyltransferase YrrM
MKPFQFEIFEKLLSEVEPTTIAEIGVHSGNTARQLISYCLKTFNKPLHYTGYDAFDLLVDHDSELNGKGSANRYRLQIKLDKTKRDHPNSQLTTEIIEGWTKNTLTISRQFDFVYIDAGHSYESVKHDYEMLKDSKIIVFDDYDMPGVKQLLDEIALTKKIEYTENTEHSRAVAVIRNYE